MLPWSVVSAACICPRFTASVEPVPFETFTIRRVVVPFPTETVFGWFAIEPDPSATDPVADADDEAPMATLLAPVDDDCCPIAVLAEPLETACEPTAVPFVAAVVELPIAVAPVPVVTEFLPHSVRSAAVPPGPLLHCGVPSACATPPNEQAITTATKNLRSLSTSPPLRGDHRYFLFRVNLNITRAVTNRLISSVTDVNDAGS